MTLGEFAFLLDVEPKWVQNVTASLGGRLRYTLRSGQRLAVARSLVESLGVPMPRAYGIAGELLRGYDGSDRPMVLSRLEGAISVSIDVHRILAGVSAGLSRLNTQYAPRRRGRRAAGRFPLETARAHGLDLTLLTANLRRTPAQRLRQLDAMVDFRRRVRRG